jgi:hypothetical protein
VRYDDPFRPRSGERPLQVSGSPLPAITLIAPGEAPGSWLACVHAHRGGNRFGYHTGELADLGSFAREWLEDPEAALARYFQYFGPEQASQEQARPAVPALPDLWDN